MKARLFFSLMALVGCASDGTSTPGADGAAVAADGALASADATPGGGSADAAAPPMLHGTPPLSPMTAPEFTVLNRDGTERTRESLLGHRTVMWFYPAAYTSG